MQKVTIALHVEVIFAPGSRPRRRAKACRASFPNWSKVVSVARRPN